MEEIIEKKNEDTEIKKQFKNLKYYILELLELLLYPAILYVILESAKFTNIAVYFKVFFTILNNSPQYIIVSYIIYLSIILIFRSIIKNKFVANCVSTAIFTIIIIVSYYKYNILEQPFVPYDIFLIKNLGQITEFGISRIPGTLFLSIIGVFIFVGLDYLFIKLMNKLEWKTENKIYIICKRLTFLIIGTVIIYIFCIYPNRYIKHGIKNDNGDNYSWMGANAVFFMHLGDFYTDKPKNYNEEKISEIKEEYNTNTNEEEQEHPNVILIMNESFADLSDLSNVTYSEDPMKLIENLKSEGNCKTGEILSPVLGGGTSLPEFEVLTGLTSYYLEQQIYPYTSYIHSDMNSIVREFNKSEYTTVGIHTNTRTFYNRENIYEYLGFEKTVFEEDIENPEYKGNYISDNEAANQVIQQFESNEGNKFIFAVTMQNHMKYINKNYEKYDIDIESSVLTKREITELKNYTQGVIDACEMYNKLVKYLKQIDEPTVLIMFGDHLPLLGDSYCSTYKKTKLQQLDYYKTPYIVWANYEIEEMNTIPELISPSNLGLITLDIANIQNTSWFIKPFAELYKKYPAINNKFAIDESGNLIDLKSLQTEELIKKCEILQYDILIKKKYIPVKY